MQHLANQAAAALKLHEQQSIREKLFRSEKLAAAGQLISGIAGELRPALAAIDSQCRAGLLHAGPTEAGELQAVLDHCAEASRLVERLVAFADPVTARLETVDLNQLLRALMDLRQQQWRARGIQCRLSQAPGSLPVAGAAAQLEQAFLLLLINAEQTVLQTQDRSIEIATSVLGKQAVTRFGHAPGPSEDRQGLQVAEGIVLAHGGQLRTHHSDPMHCVEVFLPLAEADVPELAAPAEATRPLTTLVADPDPVTCRELIRLLGDRRHRAVPAANAEEALDLMERMRFDVAFCSVRQPGADWIELRNRSRSRVDAFILLTEGVDPELTAAVGGAGRLLQKPLSSAALDQLLRNLAAGAG
jgi:CheY-like chemotaxis protein